MQQWQSPYGTNSARSHRLPSRSEPLQIMSTYASPPAGDVLQPLFIVSVPLPLKSAKPKISHTLGGIDTRPIWACLAADMATPATLPATGLGWLLPPGAVPASAEPVAGLRRRSRRTETCPHARGRRRYSTPSLCWGVRRRGRPWSIGKAWSGCGAVVSRCSYS